MISSVLKPRKWAIWLALAGYLLFGTHAFAGVVTCFAANGHIATEWSHSGAISQKLAPGFEAQTSGHGPCVDVVAEIPASPSQVKTDLRGDLSGPLPILPSVATCQLRLHNAAVVGIPSPPRESGGDALSAFVETVRLLI
jgi:hypothetical protein